jgi:hypothetical protein
LKWDKIVSHLVKRILETAKYFVEERVILTGMIRKDPGRTVPIGRIIFL